MAKVRVIHADDLVDRRLNSPRVGRKIQAVYSGEMRQNLLDIWPKNTISVGHVVLFLLVRILPVSSRRGTLFSSAS